jgi:ATP-dependent protease ClpP protease subunit
MSYCINPNSDEPIFCLLEQIGKDDKDPTAAYVNGNDFARELLYMDGEGKKRIQIWINSEGGNVKEGLSICSAILQTKTKIDVLIIGIAYSIAGVIALMGRKVEMMDFSTLMYHLAYNEDGTKDEGLDVVNKMLVTAIAGRSGKSAEDVESLMKATTFYHASEAKNEGLIDYVINCGESNVLRATADTKAKHAFGIKYINKILPNQKSKEMTPEEIQTQIEAGVAKAVAAINKKKNDDDAEDKKNAWPDEKAAYDKKIKDLEDEQAKAKAAADMVTQKAAADMVTQKAKAKIELTIKNKGLKMSDKEIANYVDFAGTTEETLNKVVETIEAIPSVKKAPVFNKTVNTDSSNKLSEIPLIEAKGTDADGNPIAGDTTSVINAINSFNYKKHKN